MKPSTREPVFTIVTMTFSAETSGIKAPTPGNCRREKPDELISAYLRGGGDAVGVTRHKADWFARCPQLNDSNLDGTFMRVCANMSDLKTGLAYKRKVPQIISPLFCLEPEKFEFCARSPRSRQRDGRPVCLPWQGSSTWSSTAATS